VSVSRHRSLTPGAQEAVLAQNDKLEGRAGGGLKKTLWDANVNCSRALLFTTSTSASHWGMHSRFKMAALINIVVGSSVN
jgi:hypothetical protein